MDRSEEHPVGIASRADDRQAALIGVHYDLSFLSDLQIRILVAAALQGSAVRAIPESLEPGGGVEVGPQRFAGRSSVDAVTALLHAGYLQHWPQGHLTVTARGQRLGEIATRSARTMRVPDDPRGHA